MKIYILDTRVDLCFLPLSPRSVGVADIIGVYTVLLLGFHILLLGLQLSMLTTYEITTPNEPIFKMTPNITSIYIHHCCFSIKNES